MANGKGQRKYPIPAGFIWSHNLDRYAHPDGRTWDPNNNTMYSPQGGVIGEVGYEQAGTEPPKAEAQPAAQSQQPGTSSETLDQQIHRLGATAPRVTPADVQAAIKSCHFFTAAQGVSWAIEETAFAAGQGVLRRDVADLGAPEELKLLTLCVLVLHNGFTIVGKSACASPDNFRREIGERVAREDAESQIWPLLGFSLKQKLYEQEIQR